MLFIYLKKKNFIASFRCVSFTAKCQTAVDKCQHAAVKTSEEIKLIGQYTIKMLKSVFCRLNTITSRNFIRVSGKLSAIEYQSNKRNGRTNDRSTGYGHVIAFTSLPTFLAFFQTKDDEQPPELEPTFWDKILPEDIALLIKKKPVEDETTPEGKLKTTLKRTILAIRKKEFDKAEQMAHLALRMAQDIKHYDGITLCYDVMANLAFDREQYQKAEKLFESVLQRLLQKGVPQDDIQVCVCAFESNAFLFGNPFDKLINYI